MARALVQETLQIDSTGEMAERALGVSAGAGDCARGLAGSSRELPANLLRAPGAANLSF
jgi:hypothetical protein